MVKCFFLIFPGDAESFPCDTNAALNCHPGGFLHTCITRCQQRVKSHYIRINALLWPHGEIAENTGRDQTSPWIHTYISAFLANLGTEASSWREHRTCFSLWVLEPFLEKQKMGLNGLCSLGLECGQILYNETAQISFPLQFSRSQSGSSTPPPSSPIWWVEGV